MQVRNIYIGNKDLEKYGRSIGCKGCEAQSLGIRGVNHSERCRTRTESAIQLDDPERYGRVLSKLIQESVEKGEGKDKKEEEPTAERRRIEYSEDVPKGPPGSR